MLLFVIGNLPAQDGPSGDGPPQQEAAPADTADETTDTAAADPAARGRLPVGMLLTAEGDRLTLFRAGSVSTYDPYLEPTAGVPVLPGTLLQLEEDTTVELQLLPGRTRVKVSANATIRLEEVTAEGGARMTAYYGRLRVVIPQSGGGPVTVSGPDAEVSVEPGSDVSVDVLADPETAAAYTAAATVSGGATMRPRSAGAATESVAVPAGGAVRTRSTADGVVVDTSDELPAGVTAFWIDRAFEATARGPEVLEERFPAAFAYVYGFYAAPALAEAPPEPQPAPAEPQPEPAEEPGIDPLPTLPELDLTPPEFADRDRTDLRNGGIGLMAMGALFAGAGFGVDYAANAIVSDAVRPSGLSPGTVMMYAGGGFFAGGLIAFIVSQF